MSNRMYWYIIGNLIGLLLFGLAIQFKEGRNKNAAAPASAEAPAPQKTSAPAKSESSEAESP